MRGKTGVADLCRCGEKTRLIYIIIQRRNTIEMWCKIDSGGKRTDIKNQLKWITAKMQSKTAQTTRIRIMGTHKEWIDKLKQFNSIQITKQE